MSSHHVSARLHLHAVLVAAALAVLLAACGANGTSSSTASSGGAGTSGTNCTTSNQVINGISTEIFCGPAIGHVTVGGQSYTITNGACFNQMGLAGVNIGHEVLGATSSAAQALRAQYDYLGAEAQATKDGTYPNSIFSGNHLSVDFTSTGTITLSNNLQAGSFTGAAISGGQHVTGSWTC